MKPWNVIYKFNYNRLFFASVRYLVAFFLGATLYLNSTNALSENTSWYKEFVNSVGEILYAAAWPTATYESVSFEGVENIQGNIYLKIKLYGRSAFDDSSLWTEVIVKIQNGEIKDVYWGKHNAIIAKPGETVAAFGQLISDLNKKYEKSTRTGSTTYRLTCIINKTGNKIYYKYKWGDNAWNNDTLDSGYSSWYSSLVDVKFFIEFDGDFVSGYQPKNYWLYTKLANNRSCDDAKKYEFVAKENQLDMLSTN